MNKTYIATTLTGLHTFKIKISNYISHHKIFILVDTKITKTKIKNKKTFTTLSSDAIKKMKKYYIYNSHTTLFFFFLYRNINRPANKITMIYLLN